MNIEKQKQICRNDWFKNHVASLVLEPELIAARTADVGRPGTLPSSRHNYIIAWQDPDNWNYGCRFIIHRRWLTVVGDIGEAVYEWNGDLSLEFLSQIEFHYFHSKCRASETGTKFYLWDSEDAAAAVHNYIRECESEMIDSHGMQWLDKAKTDIQIAVHVAGLDMLRSIDSDTPRDEFEQIIRAYYLEYGGESETIGGFIAAGEHPHPRAVGYFVGLQMAIAQISASSSSSPSAIGTTARVEDHPKSS